MIGWLAAGLALLLPTGAMAQNFGQILDTEIPLDLSAKPFPGVRERLRPELQPMPIEIGGLALAPTLDTALGSTSNVLGSQDAHRADGYAEWQPQLVATLGDTPDRFLRMTLDYDGKRYFDTPAKRQDGHFIGATGQTGLGVGGDLVVTAWQQRSYEDQLAGTFPQGGGGAVAIDQSHGQARLAQSFNRLTWTNAVTFDRLLYRATVTTTGVLLPQSYRDGSVFRASSRLDYRLGRSTALFTQLSWRDTSYAADSVYADRSSQELRALGGVSADVTGLIRVSGGVGGYWRQYTDGTAAGPRFGDFSGLVWDLRSEYALSPITTLSLQGKREFVDANLAPSPGYVASTLRVQLDHEFLRQLLVSASFGAEGDDFRLIERRDRLHSAALWADYWISPHWLLKPRIERLDRSSRGSDAGPRIPEFRSQLAVSWRD